MWLQAMGTRHVIALHQNLQEFPHTKPAFYNTGSTRWWMLQHKLDASILMETVHPSGLNTSFLAVIETLIFWQHIWMALQLKSTPQNLQTRLMVMVIVVWCLLLSGDMQVWIVSRMSTNLKIKITWTTLVNLPSGSMKLVYPVITTSSWSLLQTLMLTTLFLFTWDLLICFGGKDTTTFLSRWNEDARKRERQHKRRTRWKVGKKMKRGLGKTGATGHNMAMVDPQLHRPEHGDASECILL